ncbi:Argonaute complex, subunit Arb1 [Lasiosphaeris hirsuta]|uniref:Argonaute complex, subunit Arb1 n=1 Tax=Lasiosphaeris hirsuta TaxID=260670 RepID=A0AA40AG17_9PEZI|nr:Argonaute complex, subunit Arb1 [Lasiosphaeris hirsuta]
MSSPASPSSPADSGAASVGDTVNSKPSQRPENAENAEVTVVEAKAKDDEAKKKRKKRAGKKKAVTGFEEYYCDPPLTPAEYEEEKNILYPSYRPFDARIEECIQRFRARRRMTNIQDDLFSRYLYLGGVDSTQRQFQGTRNMKKEEMGGLSQGEVRDIIADDVIQRGASNNPRFYNPTCPEHWEVDFVGVVAGFLSVDLVEFLRGSGGHFNIGAEVVSNFLKYVYRHEVCPEYSEDIVSALKLCDKARAEMAAIYELYTLVPGSFNEACSLLFGQGDDERHTLNTEWSLDQKKVLDKSMARTIFGVHVALLSDRDHSHKISNAMKKNELAITETTEQTVEVVKRIFPNEQLRARYRSVINHLDTLESKLEIEVCGSLVVRPTVVIDGWDNPTADDDKDKTAEESEVFFVEESILKLLEVGMKLKAVVCTLNTNLKFIKCVHRIYHSFYTFLPQELMFYYKEPAKGNRPAPNVHDADEDSENENERILDGIPDDGVEE